MPSNSTECVKRMNFIGKDTGRVVGVFRPKKWGRVGQITPPQNNPNVQRDLSENVRVAFEGSIAEDSIWNRYCGWPVSDGFCNPRRRPTPYMYFNC